MHADVVLSWRKTVTGLLLNEQVAPILTPCKKEILWVNYRRRYLKKKYINDGTTWKHNKHAYGGIYTLQTC